MWRRQESGRYGWSKGGIKGGSTDSKEQGRGMEYQYAGTETGDNQVGEWSCVETRRTSLEEVLKQEGSASPIKTADDGKGRRGDTRIKI